MKPTVLIIDDIPEMRSTLRRSLRRTFDVTLAADGLEGLRACADVCFDLILCDMMMPTMNGRDFYAKLVELDSDQATRVIFMTGGAHCRADLAFLSATNNPCVEKPFDVSALRSKMLSMIESRSGSGASEPCCARHDY